MCIVVGAQIWVVSMDDEWQVIDVLLGSDKALAPPQQRKRGQAAAADDEAEPEELGEYVKNLYHRAETIECFDVAEASKDIVTYSTVAAGSEGEQAKCLIVYGLRDQGHLNGVDTVLTAKINDLTKGANFESPMDQHL